MSAGELVARLSGAHSQERVLAAQELRERPSSKAFDALRRILTDKDENARVVYQAIWAMRSVADPRAEPLLQALLKHKDQQVRHSAAWALSPPLSGANSVPFLVEALKDDSASVRRRACESLGVIGDPRAAPPLAELLADQDPYVRGDAAEALGLIAAPGTAEKLLKLELKDDWTKLSVANALLDLGDLRAVERLVALTESKDTRVARNARTALRGGPRRIGGRYPINWRERFEKDPEGLKSQVAGRIPKRRAQIEKARVIVTAGPGEATKQQIEEWAARFNRTGRDRTARMKLLELGDAAIPAVGEAFVQARGQYPALSKLLVELGPNSAPYLFKALPRSKTRSSAAQALALLLGHAAIEGEVLRMASDETVESRIGAARILARASFTEARQEALLALLADPQEDVRYTVLAALRDGGNRAAMGGKVKAKLLALGLGENYRDRLRTGQVFAYHLAEQDFRDAYLKLLVDPHREVVLSMVQYAARLDGETVSPHLVKLLDRDDPVIMARAADRLARLGDPRGIETVVALLKCKDHYALRTAMETIRNQNLVQARPQLIEYFKQEKLPETRAAFRAMKRIGDASCCEVMLKIANSGAPYRTSAIGILGQLGDQSLLGQLEELAKSQDARVARAAGDAIRSINNRKQ